MTPAGRREPRVIVLAGRRIDAEDAAQPRFPLANIGQVRERLRALFVERGAEALVCSAACGADLIALDIAGELGMRRYIVLPFEPERFRRVSVTDRPGDWGPLFDRILQEVGPHNVLVLAGEGGSEALFHEANAVMLEEALAIAGHEHAERVLAVAVWEGAPRGENDFTASFIQFARARAFDVVGVPTGRHASR